MPKIREIFQLHQDEYMARYGETMPPWHRQALHDVAACRTQAMGGHVQECGDCGHREYMYHSCRSRACPACHSGETAAWLAARAAELLPVRYFHVVFTVPEALREPLRRNQTALCGALMRAAAEAVSVLAADPKYLGGAPGILAVLHTWGRTLVWHPHVHCLVTAGGVAANNHTWLEAPNPAFLVPVQALGAVFRGRFAALARAAAPDLPLPGEVFAPGVRWVVHAKPCLAGAAQVVDYLGRYIRRCLQHVPPTGFHRIRYYGLWSPACRDRLRRVMLMLAAAISIVAEFAQAAHQAVAVCRCPRCQSRNVRAIAWFRPGEHGPP
ncbi:MAG: transposase [bacterium]